jgi:hypothetical protein
LKTEVRGSDLVLGIETQLTEDRERTVTGRFDFPVVAHALDLDELSEIGDGVERYSVLIECVSFPLFFHDSCRREPEISEDSVHRFVAVYDGFPFLTRLRVIINERSLVRESGCLLSIRLFYLICLFISIRLFSNTERFVGL